MPLKNPQTLKKKKKKKYLRKHFKTTNNPVDVLIYTRQFTYKPVDLPINPHRKSADRTLPFPRPPGL
jgi:hypothetical protein